MMAILPALGTLSFYFAGFTTPFMKRYKFSKGEYYETGMERVCRGM